MSQKLATEISIDENGDHQWQQGQVVEVEITDLTDNGDGVGRFAGRVVFVPDTAIGDRVIVRLLRVKPTYAHGKFTEILVNSADRIRPPCIVADKCGGCQWLHINYASQLEVKRNQIIQVLQRIGNIPNPPVADVLPSSNPLGYRNKVSYPIHRSATGQVKVGYYKKGSHELINLNQCPVQDQRLNPLLAEVKQDIQAEGWSIYDEKLNRGKLRYLSLRIGSNTGEILLTLVSTSDKLTDLDIMAQMWLERYPNLVGVCLNIQPNQSNTILGDTTVCIAGKSYLEEEFLGLKFHLLPDTFFQVNTEGAASLFDVILTELNLQGNEVLVDAYCGVGTFTLPFAKKVKQVIGLEVQSKAIEQAQINAELNQIDNVLFEVGSVENLLPELTVTPDIVLLDPPRQGCDRAVISALLEMKPQRIVYISCRPATLARDLKLLCEGGYHLTLVKPADFFPQTSHVESVAFLISDQ